MTGARTGVEHAERIRAVIAEAEADGFDVWIRNGCCGCSRMGLMISPIGVGLPDTLHVVAIIPDTDD